MDSEVWSVITQTMNTIFIFIGLFFVYNWLFYINLDILKATSTQINTVKKELKLSKIDIIKNEIFSIYFLKIYFQSIIGIKQCLINKSTITRR